MTLSTFAGSWTLVTGGASGIGLAVAQVMAQRGSNLVLLDRDTERLAAARERLSALGVQVRAEAADVSAPSQLESLARQLTQDGIHIQQLVTAAGILQPMRDIESLEQADHDRVWQVNYHGTYHCCRIWGEPMRSAGAGAIVTVSSITAMRATPLIAYGPAKAALQALTASLSVSYAQDGVRINAVAPGFTLTEALDAKFASGQRDPAAILSHIPMKRFARPEEIGNAVAFLLSEQASAVTGISLPVDCGWLAGGAWSTYTPLGQKLDGSNDHAL
ncbi:oxidoreductase, short chain dehydrogenase/reductase family protein [Ostertagia ostertagi]